MDLVLPRSTQFTIVFPFLVYYVTDLTDDTSKNVRILATIILLSLRSLLGKDAFSLSFVLSFSFLNCTN